MKHLPRLDVKLLNSAKHFLKNNYRSYKVLVPAVVLVLVSSALAFHTVSTHNKLAEQNRKSEALQNKLQDERAAELAKKKQDSKAQGSDEQNATPQNKNADPTKTSQNGSSKQVTKYSTSSDPRSTAYSTTPPAANPASFETKITRSSQVPAGTLIVYNATKNEKIYYGGDLVISPSVVTISKSNPALTQRNVVISAPDGAVIGMPSLPWDARVTYFWIAADSTKAKPSGASFEMFVDGGTSAPVGTYQLHITTGRTQQTADGWQYDGFITIRVVD